MEPKLEDNLAELVPYLRKVYAALHQENFAMELPKLHRGSTWMGRSLKEEDPTLTYQGQIDSIFHSVVALTVPFLKQYEEYLLLRVNGNVERCDGTLLREEDVQFARRKITHVYDNVRALVKLFGKYYADNLFLSPTIRKNLSLLVAEFDSPPFKPRHEIFNLLGKYRSIIALEGINGGPLPLKFIKNVSQNFRRLRDKDKKKLKKWVIRLNESGKLEVRIFHKALSALIQHINTHHSVPRTPQADLAGLELAMVYQDCNVFSTPDPKHLKWRAALKEDSEIFYNRKPLVLGNSLGVKTLEKDTDLIFTVVNRPGYVLRIGCNRAIIPLNKKALENPLDNIQWGIPNPKYSTEGIDASGRYALVERVFQQRDHDGWSSANGILSDIDRTRLEPLIQLINGWLSQGVFPDNFHPDYLRLNKDNQIRSLRGGWLTPTIKVINIEESVYWLAAGSREVYQYFIDAIHLHDHIASKFFTKVLSMALKNEECTYSTLAACSDIDDGDVVSKAEKFYKEAVQLQGKIRAHLDAKYVIEKPAALNALIEETILSFYRKSRTFGRFWPTLEQDVLNVVIRDFALVLK